MRKSIFRFLRRTDGTATVETVLWFPFFIAIFGLMFDMAMVFHGQAKVLRVVQDANRELSIGRYASEDATELAIKTELAALKVWPTKTETTVIAGVASTNVQVPVAQFGVLGYFSAINRITIGVSAEHMIENWET